MDLRHPFHGPEAFTVDGLLPPGDYEMTLSQLRRSLLVVGPGPKVAPHWDYFWRARLVDGLEVLSDQLNQVGIQNIYVDGSFAEEKDHPNDIDGYFECEAMALYSGRLQAELNALDPFRVWTWSNSARRPHRGYPEGQLPMWHQYRVKLWPHCTQPFELQDRFGNGHEFPAAFRTSRAGQPRGIIKLRRQS